MPEIRRLRRRSPRFRPVVNLSDGGPAALERRLLLSVVAMTAHAPHHADLVQPKPHPASRTKDSGGASHRVTPAQEINKQYDLFYTNFRTVEAAYVRALNQQSNSTVTATTTLTAPYPSGTASMQVADAGIFGPEGVYSTPVTATAMVGAVPVGSFSLIGSSGNQLAINTTQSSQISLATGTTLTAQVTNSSATSAQSIFPNYISTSAQQLAVNLVAYFNSLPIKLPRMYAPPHQPQRSGALQQYVYQLVAGSSPLSLEQTLIGLSLPQTSGGDLEIYDAAVQSALTASRTQMLSGVQQIFAGKLPVIPINGSSSSSSTSTTSTGSSSTSSGTGSTSTGG